MSYWCLGVDSFLSDRIYLLRGIGLLSRCLCPCDVNTGYIFQFNVYTRATSGVTILKELVCTGSVVVQLLADFLGVSKHIQAYAHLETTTANKTWIPNEQATFRLPLSKPEHWLLVLIPTLHWCQKWLFVRTRRLKTTSNRNLQHHKQSQQETRRQAQHGPCTPAIS